MEYLITFILLWPLACLLIYTAVEISAYRAGAADDTVHTWIKELSDMLTEIGIGGTDQTKHCAFCGGQGHLAKDCPWRTINKLT